MAFAWAFFIIIGICLGLLYLFYFSPSSVIPIAGHHIGSLSRQALVRWTPQFF